MVLVDPPEVVDVEHGEIHDLPGPPRKRELSFDGRNRAAAVGQSGQRVGFGERPQKTHPLEPVGDPSQQFRPIERLRDAVVGARLEDPPHGL